MQDEQEVVSGFDNNQVSLFGSEAAITLNSLFDAYLVENKAVLFDCFIRNYKIMGAFICASLVSFKMLLPFHFCSGIRYTIHRVLVMILILHVESSWVRVVEGPYFYDVDRRGSCKIYGGGDHNFFAALKG